MSFLNNFSYLKSIFLSYSNTLTTIFTPTVETFVVTEIKDIIIQNRKTGYHDELKLLVFNFRTFNWSVSYLYIES